MHFNKSVTFLLYILKIYNVCARSLFVETIPHVLLKAAIQNDFLDQGDLQKGDLNVIIHLSTSM